MNLEGMKNELQELKEELIPMKSTVNDSQSQEMVSESEVQELKEKLIEPPVPSSTPVNTFLGSPAKAEEEAKPDASVASTIQEPCVQPQPAPKISFWSIFSRTKKRELKGT